MGHRQDQPLSQRRIGFAVAAMAVTVAVTPLVLSLIAAREGSSSRGFVLGTAVAWLVAVVAYRGLSNTYDHRRRKALREEIAELRQARIRCQTVSLHAIRSVRILGSSGLIRCCQGEKGFTHGSFHRLTGQVQADGPGDQFTSAAHES